MKLKHSIKNRAFTLIEGLIVIAIIAIIIAIIWGVAGTKVKVIDGCQYLETYNGHGWSITHKGNCTNQIHFQR